MVKQMWKELIWVIAIGIFLFAIQVKFKLEMRPDGLYAVWISTSFIDGFIAEIPHCKRIIKLKIQ